MTNMYQSVIAKNPLIAAEISKSGKMINKPSDFVVFKKKSAAAKTREALTLRYESKKNQCPDCFTAIPMTGICDCKE